MLVPFLLNWRLNPYHAPLVVAKEKGFYKDVDIDLCLLEPRNPSEVTRIIGEGHVPLGLKAMVHCFAARDRGYPIQSIGTVLDEPPTGLISPTGKNIHSIADIQGKRLGYVGEFGKVMIDKLAKDANIPKNSYKTLRVGMDAAHNILHDKVDAAIGLSCFQQIEVEEAGMPTNFLRIDHAANLGCCCFCSIMVIAHESYIQRHADLLHALMQATVRGLSFTREYPEEAFNLLIQANPTLDTPAMEKIFFRTLPFFSKEGLNVERDWQKVAGYAKSLGIFEADSALQGCYTNEFLSINEMN